jgi:hypothetical protein
MWTTMACEGGDERAWRLRHLLSRRTALWQRREARVLADAWIEAHPPEARPNAQRASAREEPDGVAAPQYALEPRRRTPSSQGIGDALE